jgi:hypothetical protein
MDRLRVGRSVSGGLLLMGVLIWLTLGILPAEGREKADGILTGIETDGTVIINDGGYLVDTAARILNSRGEKITLDKLVPPVRVYFEFDSTKNGAVIKLIKEVSE